MLDFTLYLICFHSIRLCYVYCLLDISHFGHIELYEMYHMNKLVFQSTCMFSTKANRKECISWTLAYVT